MNRIDRYIEAYFDGSATPAQERRLKRFLASPAGQDSRYDEVRAVAGFFSVGKSLHKARGTRPAMPYAWKAGLAAAMACCIAAALVIGDLSGKRAAQEDECWAYVSGQRITDRTLVMDEMENTLSDLMAMHSDIYEQLDDFFGE